MRPVIRGILLDVAPSLVAYYGLRALGTSEYVALLTATIVAGAKVCFDAIKARRLDPFAGYLMLNFGLSLAVGLATSDARLLMAGNALVGGLGALIFLGSCVIGRPLTQVVSDRVQPADERSREEPTGTASDEEPDPAADAYKRRVHILLSAMWGIGLLIGTFVSLAIIFTLSVDVAKGVDTVVSLAFTGVLLVATVLIGIRAGRRWEQRAATQG
jgi:hypothetical protein